MNKEKKKKFVLFQNFHENIESQIFIENFRACRHDKAPTIGYNKKVERCIHQLSYGVQCTGVNTSALILGTFRESE